MCYEELNGKVTTNKCGHCFHTRCFYEWYLKAEEPSCPMCRAPVLFKGIIKSGWKKSVVENSSSVEEFTDWVFDEMNHDETLKPHALHVIKEAQVLWHTASELGYDKDEIDYMLWTFDWISPKHITRNGPKDRPVPDTPSKQSRKNNGLFTKKKYHGRNR